MDCPTCGHENPPESQSCLECGTAVSVRCANCDAELPPASKFCNLCGAPTGPLADDVDQLKRDPLACTPKHLAEKILTSRSALEGERKQVTVLFADVKGSMERAGRMDPEDWSQLMQRFFGILRGGVERFEGFVDKFTGDGIMALFGAPIAHEDHAARACYAALHVAQGLREFARSLLDTRGLELSTRIGINSGEVVVGKIGDDLRMDYTAQGQTVGLAQRVEQICEPGEVTIAEPTARLVDGFFRVRDLGLVSLKGVARPTRVYRLEGPGASHSRLEVARRRGLSKFVGRTEEIAALEAALVQARSGLGQVVGIVGEPGVGKSRLCLEFMTRCQAGAIPVFEAHCPSHGAHVPFLPILELFRGMFRIAASEPVDVTRRKIGDFASGWTTELRNYLPVLFDFLGVREPGEPAPRADAETRQRQLAELMRGLLRAAIERESVAVVIIDDMHWIDPASDAFIAQLVSGFREAAAVLVLNFRPAYEPEWPGTDYLRLMVEPLDAGAARDLTRHLLGDEPSLAPFVKHLESLTTGNPFFAEELVKMWVESGRLRGTPGHYRPDRDLELREVPVNVQAVLAARIDRLPVAAKRILQTAAVIGRRFSEAILAAVAELSEADLAPVLKYLQKHDFLYEVSLDVGPQ